MIMDTRRSSLEDTIRRNILSLCRVVEPQALFLAVSFHLHDFDEDRLDRELNSTKPKCMVVYHIVVALRLGSPWNWQQKLVDALRQAKQTEALRIIGEDSDENLDENKQREVCPQLSSEAARLEVSQSFSPHPDQLVSQDRWRQPAQDRRSQSLCAGPQGSVYVAQCSPARGERETGLSARPAPHSGDPPSETSIEFTNVVKNALVQNPFTGYSRQGDPGARREDGCNLFRQSSAVLCSDATGSAPETEPGHPRSSADDDTNSQPPRNIKIQHGDRRAFSEIPASLEDNARQQGGDDDFTGTRTGGQDDGQGASDTEVDSGSSADPANSTRVRFNDSSEETQRPENSDSSPPRGTLGNGTSTVSNSYNIHIEKVTIKGEGNGLNLGSTVCNNISRTNLTPENIRPSDNSESASALHMPADLFRQTLLKTWTNSATDQTLSHSVQERSRSDLTPLEASFELADTSSVRDVMRANQAGSPSTDKVQMFQSDPRVQLMLLKSTDDEVMSPCPPPLSAAETPSGLSDSSSSIVVLHESDKSSTESAAARSHLKGRAGSSGHQPSDTTAKECLVASVARGVVSRQAAAADTCVLEVESRPSSVTATLTLPESVQEDNSHSSTDTHLPHSCLPERCLHLTKAEAKAKQRGNAEARTNQTDKSRQENVCPTGASSTHSAKQDKSEQKILRSTGGSPVQPREVDVIRFCPKQEHHSPEGKQNIKLGMTDDGLREDKEDEEYRVTDTKSFEDKQNAQFKSKTGPLWKVKEITRDTRTDEKPCEAKEMIQDKGTDRKPSEAKESLQDKGTDRKPSEAQEIRQDTGIDRKPPEAQEIRQDTGTDRNASEAKEIRQDTATGRKPSEDKQSIQLKLKGTTACKNKEISQRDVPDRNPRGDNRNRQYKATDGELCENCLGPPTDGHALATLEGGCEVPGKETAKTNSLSKKGRVKANRRKKLGR